VEDPSALAWFDQPDAMDRIDAILERWALGPLGRAWLTAWVSDGYFVADALIPSGVIDRLSRRRADRAGDIVGPFNG